MDRYLIIPYQSDEKQTMKTNSSKARIDPRVVFNSDGISIEENEIESVLVIESGPTHVIVEEENREGWDNKMQFMMGVISYAVGLGNVWRFPYLCQKNGGGAFLIPYCIMMVVEGAPLFLIELGIGQKMRTGPVGVWNNIHPQLGGVGVSAAIVSFLVALYYNVIITWCIYYLYKSFSLHLPWTNCPVVNGTAVEECQQSSSTSGYFWNREAIETSSSIGEFGGFVPHIIITLVLAWFLIYLCVMRGIKSSGKVMYLTATFPYVVTTIFLVRSMMLDGALEGLQYMFTPDLSRLWQPNVWLDAATQIFYSMGLGFGGLIAFASYNPYKNNCRRDCIVLSIANLLTSLYTLIVIFCVLGYMGGQNYNKCIESGMASILTVYPDRFRNFDELKQNISISQYSEWMYKNFENTEFVALANITKRCNYNKIIAQAAEGTGLAFVVFTEAIIQFPFPPLWSVLFFLMLLMLGLGSMFGTLEGVITSLSDSKLVNLKKPVITAILCSVACLVGLVFATHAGQYWVMLFDHFAGSYALMAVAFFEIFAVIYVYGWERFVSDLNKMTGDQISCYWIITWRFISPVIMFVLFFASLIKSFTVLPTYFTYDSQTTYQSATPYPAWALIIAFSMVAFAIAPVPIVWFARKFKIWKIEPDIPRAQKHLNATSSTSLILKSNQSLESMAKSNSCELRSLEVPK